MLRASERARNNPLVWPLVMAFTGSCVLFWWLQSILLHWWLGLDIPIEPKFIWVSIGALANFVIGYLLPTPSFSHFSLSDAVLDRCEQFAYKCVLIFFAPALFVAAQFAVYRSGIHYNEGHGPSLLTQAILYTYLFFGLLYVGAVRDNRRSNWKLLLVVTLTIAPRLLISLHWGRFFAAQAIVPILFIAIARRWIRFTWKRLIQLSVVALFIVFVPALTRGDTIFGQDEQGYPQIVNYFGYMNSLGLFQEGIDLSYPCPPLLLSLTAKVIPYSSLGVCTIDVGNQTNLPATMEQLLTREYTDDVMAGVGSNYMLELYLTGGLAAVFIGSVIFGFISRTFVGLISCRSIYAGIWAECLTRSLFAPRGNLGYVYERIPSLVLATLAVVLVSWSFSKLSQPALRGEEAC
jgi:oligosaccharide repeat unit polymerase